MKMNVTRTLHPIGQGAFYTEKFEYDGQQCNVVFDCGGTEKFIEKEVKGYCDSLPCDNESLKPTIDAVFISHFHEDHVNGLETLLNKAEVKCIFLPLLNDDEVYALSLSFVEKLDEPLYSGLVDSAVNGKPLVVNGIPVVRIEKYKNGENPNEPPYLLHTEQNEHSDSQNKIHSGTSIKPNNSTPWIFKTFNFGNTKGKREKQLEEALKKKGIISLTDLIDKWQNPQYQEDIRKCYESVSGSMNANSMVTYSGLGKNYVTVTNRMTSKSCYWRNCSDINSFAHKAGCMYFGDYEAKGKCKWEQYEKSFGYLIDLLHVQQVPHHGSRHNYNVLLNKPKKKMNFISAGIGNKYHHPHKRTLRKINKAKAPRIWINECSEPVVFEYDVSES